MEHQTELPMLYSMFHHLSVLHIAVPKYQSQTPISFHITYPPPISTHPFSTCVALPALEIGSSVLFF